MMKRKKIILGCIIIIIVLVGIGSFLSSLIFPYTTCIRLNWNIKLPFSLRSVYEKQEDGGILGDGIRYHIFSGQKKKVLGNVVQWSDLGEYDMEEVENEMSELLVQLKVPEKWYPDFSRKYFFYSTRAKDDNRNIIYLLYDKRNGRVYVLESFF